MPHCPFCNIRRQRIFKKNEHALAIEDKMLAGVEHLLIAPKRHVDSFFTMHKPEQEALLSLIGECCESLGEKCAPQDYFVGVKECDLDEEGVSHFHFHVLPKFEGDSPQPIEGVTWLDADHGRIAVEEVYIA
tara:strand:+ start:418 stop:813 length:396 start_codon:yes stop_codon:yes gene_type:complete